MLNPLFDSQPQSPVREPSSELGFIGEASCAAFSNRMLQCLEGNYAPSTAGFSNYYRLQPSRRVPMPTDEAYCLPERMHAKLLLNVARRFIGNYHPLFLKVTFMKELDAVYRRQMTPSALWLCKFYALMALGETYTNRRGALDCNNRVPGTEYYVRAVHMLHMFQDAYEDPSLMHVEVLTLLVGYHPISIPQRGWKRVVIKLLALGMGVKHTWSCPDGHRLQRDRDEAGAHHGVASCNSRPFNLITRRTREQTADLVGSLLLREILRFQVGATHHCSGRRHRHGDAKYGRLDRG